MSRRSVAPAALVIVVLTAAVATAQMSEAVVAAFRGKIVLTRAAVAPGATDKDTIAKLRAAQLAEIAGASNDDGQVWQYVWQRNPASERFERRHLTRLT